MSDKIPQIPDDSREEDVVSHQPCYRNKYVTVEPAVVGTMFVVALYSILSKEYIRQRLAVEHNLDLNRTTNQTCSDVKDNASDPYYELEEIVSSETASWVLYLNVASCIPALFSTILLGSWSDKVGRKIPLLLSLFGTIIFVLCFLVVLVFDLSFYFLFIGHTLTGVLGHYGNVVGCSFSYVSDVTTPDTRTLRIAVLETGLVNLTPPLIGNNHLGVGALLASVTSGLWDLEKGFRNPFWCILGLAVVNFLYTIIFLSPLNEREVPGAFRHLFSKKPFVHMYRVMRPRAENNRHITLLLFSLCFCILLSTAIGVNGLLVIYAIGVPFCFNSRLVGLLSGLGQGGSFVSLISLKIFNGFSSQPRLATLGITFSIVSSILLAISKTTLMLFVAQFFQLFLNLPIPIMRSQISHIVAPDEVGSIFAVLACSTVIGDIMGSVVYQGIYAATADTAFPGAAFTASAGLLLVTLPLYWVGYYQSGLRGRTSTVQYDALGKSEREI